MTSLYPGRRSDLLATNTMTRLEAKTEFLASPILSDPYKKNFRKV